MIKVVLAGDYPANTYEKLKELLPNEKFNLVYVNSEEEYNSMTNAEIIILRIFKAPKEIIERNKNLKMIMRWGAGFDSVDIKYAGERGVLVTNTPGANANAVSELAIMLMLAVGRNLLNHTESLSQGIWSKNTFLNSSYCLNNKLVGLIGAGNIGRQVACKVQAFDAEVQYYDVFRLPKETEEKLGLKYVTLDELLETSDVISLHIPLLEGTHHIIGEEEIKKMKKGAILINTSRGGLVDDYTLERAVRAGDLLGAGLDVVENEPLEKGDKLLDNPNIIVTPHIGGGVVDIGDQIIPMLIKDILAFANGDEPKNIVNKDYL